MPWTLPNPFTGACEYKPTELESCRDALAAFWHIFLAEHNLHHELRKPTYKFSELATFIKQIYSLENDKTRFFVDVLERHANCCFRNPDYRI